MPVTLDLDLGEVFDDEYMPSNVDGVPQHREGAELEEMLRADFPDVKLVCEQDGSLRIGGHPQIFPEPISNAKMRVCYKVQQLAQKAAAKLASIVVVTHADALPAVCGFLNPSTVLEALPYGAKSVATRHVKVARAGKKVRVLPPQPVYGEHDAARWRIELGPGIRARIIDNHSPNDPAATDWDLESKIIPDPYAAPATEGDGTCCTIM